MKIAYLVNQYPQASQSFIRREIAALEELGVQIARFTLRTWDQELVDPGDREEKARTRVVLGVGALGLLWAVLRTLLTRPMRFFSAMRMALKLGKKGEKGRLYHFIYLAEACVLRRWFEDSAIEHVHAHFGTNSTAVALLVHRLGGPGYSFTCHGPEEFDRPEGLKLSEKISDSRFVVAVSQFGKSQLFRWSSHALWERMHVVHCGVDAGFLTQDWPPVPDVPKLVCVGRLCEQKGQLLLVQAAARLKERGIQFELVLVGDGPMRKEVESLIEHHNLSESVRIAGWQSNDNVRKEILSSRAMILPSFAEGLPVVVMEALILKRPVISTFIAGIPELVETGKCGYLVPAGSIEHLADAISRVLSEDVNTLREMGRNGAEKARVQHDVRREAQKLFGLFERAVGVEPQCEDRIRNVNEFQATSACDAAQA